MEVFLIKAAQLVAALALLVIVHEFGHYIFARTFGIKVEKFYLFFNPWFSLFKWKPKEIEKLNPDGTLKTTWRDTEYGIGWLPLGGYVKIAGMIDESMDKEQMEKPAQPWEFRSKPAWQRLLVMIGGVLFNFILAVIIYSGIAFSWGEKTIAFENASEGLDYVPAAQAVGFQNGDIPLMADGVKINASDRNHTMQMIEADVVTVLRGKTDTVNINIPDDFLFRLNEEDGFFAYRVPVYVQKVVAGDPASVAGMQEGDHIVAVGGVSTPSFTEFTPALAQNGGKETSITVDRNGQLVDLNITPTEAGKIGIQLRPITDIYPIEIVEYSFFESIPKGWEIGTTTLASYVSSLKHLFTAEGAQSLGGFGSIGSIFPDTWNWRSFWEIAAFLSVVLAFMNIIPIPALDGGHVLFLLYEIIARRKPSDKFLEYAQVAGMIFIFALLIFANGNDIYRFFFK
ncbi:MAG: RIP metalloprotease RseP [Muribaculaceae bacterium]|nr:RIP metalloprotease RseP [Muribaculaceae bacterium]